MKFLEFSSLADLEMQLSHMEIGDCVFHAKLEAYSCKPTGVDKKLSKSLEKRFSSEMAKSPDAAMYLAKSPVGPLTDSNARRTLSNLICTLNAAYPDYDFSGLTLDSLTRENNMEAVVRRVDSHLEQVYQCVGQRLRTGLWNSVEEVIQTGECEIYSYVSNNEGEPFDEDAQIWSIHLFFYNKRQKRVLLMVLAAFNRLALGEGKDDSMDVEMDLDDAMGSRVSMLAY
eukprot:Plantae.Rhodophyta-Purpureofilum_apyrenoidigerum.ctg25673.p1 GENE.Plantae.Rhodophyta-Purpureofilum_apyrenoidigerum.ctg25673~~Plantae.Rhodophyta-Purpureofilum_apyrenoidigerum.ctg25673.p1  ORF type:complete len:228 (-),score=58.77 Plantae.Rhodophyta-Purpureofilum_apyrenoidigerum.ctg25673:391-1074(-)